MTACLNCGKEPCATPGFCATCLGTNDLGAQLTAKLDEQRKQQEARLKELAAKDAVTYDQERQQAAKELGVRTKTLDQEVKKRRRQPSAKDIAKKAAKLQQAEFEKLQQAAGDLIHSPDILERFGKAVQACGLVGESENAKILFLALTSRLFERPVSIAIKGISAAGKSFTVQQVLRFFPAEVYFERTGMSEHALPYSDEDFQHRHIVLYEIAGMASETVSYFVRTLLSENLIKYETVEKTEEGLKSRVLEKLGPTGLISTTTAATLHAENETRFLSLGIIDSPAQTAAVLRALGRRAASGDSPGGDLAEWEAFQRWLALGERRVVIPFAERLGEAIPPIAVRLRRDFSTVLALIAAHALLHRSTRAADQQGRIIATPADYSAVCDLTAELFAQGVEATVPLKIRETVEAVKAMGLPEVSLTGLAKKLDLGKSTAHDRVQRALARGFLINNETKKGLPARIAIGDPLPEERQILPDPKVFEDCSGVRTVLGGLRQRGRSPASSLGRKAIRQKNSPQPPQAPPSTLPLPNTPNTRTPPSNSGGNGQGRQEPPPETVSAKVKIREIWRPGLGPEGDDIFDLE
jgi:hypothetical protein